LGLHLVAHPVDPTAAVGVSGSGHGRGSTTSVNLLMAQGLHGGTAHAVEVPSSFAGNSSSDQPALAAAVGVIRCKKQG